MKKSRFVVKAGKNPLQKKRHQTLIAVIIFLVLALTGALAFIMLGRGSFDLRQQASVKNGIVDVNIGANLNNKLDQEDNSYKISNKDDYYMLWLKTNGANLVKLELDLRFNNWNGVKITDVVFSVNEESSQLKNFVLVDSTVNKNIVTLTFKTENETAGFNTGNNFIRLGKLSYRVELSDEVKFPNKPLGFEMNAYRANSKAFLVGGDEDVLNNITTVKHILSEDTKQEWLADVEEKTVVIAHDFNAISTPILSDGSHRVDYGLFSFPVNINTSTSSIKDLSLDFRLNNWNGVRITDLNFQASSMSGLTLVDYQVDKNIITLNFKAQDQNLGFNTMGKWINLGNIKFLINQDSVIKDLSKSHGFAFAPYQANCSATSLKGNNILKTLDQFWFTIRGQAINPEDNETEGNQCYSDVDCAGNEICVFSEQTCADGVDCATVMRGHCAPFSVKAIDGIELR